jgi:hypothetical protein
MWMLKKQGKMDTSIVKSKDAWRIGLAQQLNAASSYTVKLTRSFTTVKHFAL